MKTDWRPRKYLVRLDSGAECNIALYEINDIRQYIRNNYINIPQIITILSQLYQVITNYVRTMES